MAIAEKVFPSAIVCVLLANQKILAPYSLKIETVLSVENESIATISSVMFFTESRTDLIFFLIKRQDNYC